MLNWSMTWSSLHKVHEENASKECRVPKFGNLWNKYRDDTVHQATKASLHNLSFQVGRFHPFIGHEGP